MNFYESNLMFARLTESRERSRLMNEMEKFFVERTKKHISRVQDFCEQAGEFFPSYADELKQRGMNHDKSKFLIPERKWYVLLTWKYKLKDEGKEMHLSDKQSEHISNVTYHHCKNNPHHPEYWSDTKGNPINKEDREKRDIIIDAAKMDDISIIEMVCDWSAMQKENGQENPKKWADENIKDRWKFKPQQEKLIYETIDLLWR